MLALLALGCTTPVEGIFVGEIPTTPGVRVAVAAGETRVALVVAGEGETLSWSRAYAAPRAEDGSFQAQADGWTASGADVPGGGFAVTLIDPDGVEEPEFTLQPPIDPTSFDGPFSGSGGACTPSAVVFNSGGQVQGAVCAADGTPVAVAVPVGGLILSNAGTVEVEADIGGGPERFVLNQLLPE